MKKNSILLLAGEASGDHHAASMVRELKRRVPGLRVTGIGGDKLADAGMELLHHYRDVNTIGLSEGLGKVRSIVRAYRTMKRELMHGEHDLFVPVDFPDVNLRLCRLAGRSGVRVCYYISPQVWAWRKGRVKKIAARVDHMMTIFPFEAQIYRDAGVKADFVGHTMVDDIPPDLDKAELRRELGLEPNSPVVALLPGSRPAEISRMLPVMCEAAGLYGKNHPETRFVLPLAGPHLSSLVQDILGKYRIPVRTYPVEAPRIMAASDSGLITSGTATLQAALVGMPHAVVYMLDRFTWWFAFYILRPLVMDRDIHVAMANVLAIGRDKEGDGPIKEMQRAGIHIPCQECGRDLFVPELLQDHATPENLASWLERFEADGLLRDVMVRGFKQIRALLSPPSNGGSPADVVLNYVGK